MTTPFTLTPPPDAAHRDRRYGHGPPRFLDDHSAQLDPLYGCPEAQVPAKHLARIVLALVEQLDTTALEREYSSLGRRGLHPKRKLAIWVYASLTGVHYATDVARLLQTDAAFRLLSGGHTMSASGLRTFRRENEAFFAEANLQVVRMAAGADLIDPNDLSTDSMRLRAEASTKSIRTATRSEARLAELDLVDVGQLDPVAKEKHEDKVAKHRAALDRCKADSRTSFSTTNESAGLLKFPSGAALPGHRVTVTACGVKLRLVLSVLIGSEPTDHGLLGPSLTAAREALRGTKLENTKLQAAADAGYVGAADLQFAIDHRDSIDVLVNDPPQPRRGKSRREGGFFSRDEFVFHEDGTATCPAGAEMRPYTRGGRTKRTWQGTACAGCPLKAACTEKSFRTVTLDIERERLHSATRDRMAEPGAGERYRRRIATIEPVFSYIEDAMRFQRASSALARTVRAEVLLKVLAYNLIRFFFCPSAQVLQVAAVWTGTEFRTLGIWSADEVLAP